MNAQHPRYDSFCKWYKGVHGYDPDFYNPVMQVMFAAFCGGVEVGSNEQSEAAMRYLTALEEDGK